MSSILVDFDRNNVVNFWELNKSFLVSETFNTLYTEDKSRAKKNSSLTMWSLALLLETSHNRLANLSEDERKEKIQKILNVEINWVDLHSLTDTYIKYTKSPLEKQLFILQNKIIERNTLLETTPYTLENVDKVDKIIITTDKISEQYNKLKEQVENEQSTEGVVKGGRKESLSEQGKLFG